MNIRDLLTERQILDFTDYPSLDAPVESHAKFCFRAIYSIPYPSSPGSEKITRPHHGIAHVSRAAAYIPILANFYRRHHHPDTHSLTPDDIHLVQIAALFHDAARLNDDKDEWDNESTLMCFYYLMKIGCSEDKAKEIAEVIANKDYEPGKIYHNLLKIGDDEYGWEYEHSCTQPKSILQKLLHDADCLDIIRARPHFEANYLDLYHDIAKENAHAFEEMAILITQVRSLICAGGDQYNENIYALKARIHNPEAYQRIEEDIYQSPARSMLAALYDHNHLLSREALDALSFIDSEPYDSSAELSNTNLQRALQEGKVLFRGIGTPTSLRKKAGRIETYAQLELEKALRRLGEPTRTQKPDARDKEGNRLRSGSILGFGSGTYPPSGYLVINPSMQDFHQISEKDVNTGRAKKKHRNADKLTVDEAQQQLEKLLRILKMGGISADFGIGWISTHTEVLFHIKEFNGVCFTNDPCFYSRQFHEDSYPFTPTSTLLQALYLQQLYRQITGEQLPLVEYSGRDNRIALRSTPHDDEVKQLWLDSANITLEAALSSLSTFLATQPGLHPFLDEITKACFSGTMNEFKVTCVYGHCRKAKSSEVEIVSPDVLYPADLQSSINSELSMLRNIYNKKAHSLIFNAIKENPQLLLNSKLYQLILTKEFTEEEDVIVRNAIERIDLDKIFNVSMGHHFSNHKVSPDYNPLDDFEHHIQDFNIDDLQRYIALLVKTKDSQRLSLISRMVSNIDVDAFAVSDSSSAWDVNSKLLYLGTLAWLLNNRTLLEKVEQRFIQNKLKHTDFQSIYLCLNEFFPVLSEQNRLILKTHWINILQQPLERYGEDFSFSIDAILKFFPDVRNDQQFIRIITEQASNKEYFDNLLYNLTSSYACAYSVFLLNSLYQFENIAVILIKQALANFSNTTNPVMPIDVFLDVFPVYLNKIYKHDEEYIDRFRGDINSILEKYYLELDRELATELMNYEKINIIQQVINLFNTASELSLIPPPSSLVTFCIGFLQNKATVTLGDTEQLNKLCRYRDSIPLGGGPVPTYAVSSLPLFAPAAPTPEPAPVTTPSLKPKPGRTL